MKTKLLASMLTVVAFVCVLAFGVSAATVTISTPEEFKTLMDEGYTMSDTFELANDIDLSGVTGQTPIGTSGKKFTGTFNGNGHTVSGINITKSTDTTYPFVGLFGLCQKATIKNVTVKGSVTGPSNADKEVYTGGLVAWTRGITITNCTSYITVVNNDSGACAGGLLGYADYNGTDIAVKITNSTNHGNVTAAQYTGGILGLTQSVEKANQVLTVTGCKNYGNITITAGNCVGGIVGYYRCGAKTSAGCEFTLSDCENYGTIENKATASTKGGFTGGIVGAVLASGTDGTYKSSITLTNLYNEGSLKRAVTASIGSIVGYLTLPVVTDGTVDVTISDWVNNGDTPDWIIYAMGDAEVPVALTMTNMVNNNSGRIFSSSVNLDEDFTISTNNTVTLDGYITSKSTEAEKKAFVEGNSDYYFDNGSIALRSMLELDTEIGSPEELVLLMQVANDATTLGKDYKLLCDIDMTGYEQGMIGSSGAGNRFTGTFDGQGHTISGLNISNNTMGTGLFAVTDGATIKNLNVEGKIAGTGTSGSRVGGLVGVAQGDLTVTNCNVDVTLTASSGASGGILGTHTGGTQGTVTITGCTVNGSIKGAKYMGGFVGYVIGAKNVNIVISDSVNNASVDTTSGNVPGGFLGYYNNTNAEGKNTISITSCQNTGAITSNGGEGTCAAGIVGAIGGDTANSNTIASVTISNVSNTGTISGTAATSGSIAGVLRAANGTEYAISDVYAVGNLFIVGEAGTNADATDLTTFDFARVYNPEGTRLIANNQVGAEYITQDECFHEATMAQTSLTSYYNMTAESDAWVMTYDGPRLTSFKGDSVEVDYSIDSKADLIDLMNAPYAWGGGTFTLTKNIDISGEAHSPIGTGGNFKFMADFDGKGYTISGLNINEDGQGAGLFGTVQYGSVKNLTVKGTVNGGDSRVGGLIGVARAPFVVENVTVDVDVTSVNGATGGILGLYAGYENKVLEITDCTFNGTVNGRAYNGGIVGYVLEAAEQPMNLIITGCTNNGDITGTGNGNGDILGTTIVSSGSVITVDGCKNTGAVSGTSYNGGIFGYIYNAEDAVVNGATYTITGCENSGEVSTTTGNVAGGIFGFYGNISTGTENNALIIEKCENSGSVTAKGGEGTYAGGIAGAIGGGTNKICRIDVTLSELYNTSANITAKSYQGGIAGALRPLAAGGYTISDLCSEGTDLAIIGVFGTGTDTFTVTRAYNISGTAIFSNASGNTVNVVDGYTKNSAASEVAKLIENANWVKTKYGPRLEEFTTADDFVFVHTYSESVWTETATGTYEFKCNDCGEVAAAAETPYVYVDAYTFMSAFVGDDENDGVTPESAVYTIEEAVRRLAVTGGKVIICDRYYLGKDGVTEINLPAYEKLITFTATTKDNGKANTGFAVVTNGVHFNLGGPTKFENIIFNGSAATQNSSDNGYYKIPVICANWNDLEFGLDISAYGMAYIVAGNCYHSGFTVASELEDAEKTQNLVFSKVTAHNISDSEGNKLQNAVTFFGRVYLGDRVRAGSFAEGMDSYTVANKTITATFNNSTVIDMYAAAATSPEDINAQMQNIDTTINLNDAAYVRYLHTGDGNTEGGGNGTAYMDKLTVNVNDNARVYGAWTFENIHNLAVNISAEEDGREDGFGLAARLYVTVSKGYVATGDENVAVTYGSHSFKKGVLAPAFNVVYNGKTTVTVKDDCDYDEAVLDVVEGVYVQTCSYCGAVKTTEAADAIELASDKYKYGMSAVLANEILPEYLVQLSNEFDVTEAYLKVERFADGESEPAVEIVEPYKATVGTDTTVYRFLAPGVAAKEMNDTIKVTFYALVNGDRYVAKTVEKNIVDYYNMAYKAYGNETRGQAPAFMATLYSLLNYGAEAQRYFEYNTDALVNAVLPADKVVTEFTAEASAEVEVASDCAEDVYTISGFTPILEDRVVLALGYALEGDAPASVTFKGSYNDINGNAVSFEADGANIVVTETSVVVYVDVIAAKDLRQMITGALYSGDTQVSDSVSFSFECYATIADAAEENICAAILNYADAAKALFYVEPTVVE